MECSLFSACIYLHFSRVSLPNGMGSQVLAPADIHRDIAKLPLIGISNSFETQLFQDCLQNDALRFRCLKQGVNMHIGLLKRQELHDHVGGKRHISLQLDFSPQTKSSQLNLDSLDSMKPVVCSVTLVLDALKEFKNLEMILTKT